MRDVFWSLREHRNYRIYFAGQVVSLCGTWMADTALPWLALELGGTPFSLGVVAFCRYLPYALLGLFTGALADRFETRHVLVVTQAGSLLVAATLAALALTGSAELWHVYALAAASGFLVLLELPSRQLFTFELVGPEDLPNAVALSTSLQNAARIGGPALGGVVIAAVGAGWCFLLNAASFVAALAALLMIRPDTLAHAERPAKPPGILYGLREAAVFAWRSPRLRIVLVLLAVLSLVGVNFRVLLPVLASRTLAADADVFGLLYACFGIGGLAGSLLAASARWASAKPFLVGYGAYGLVLLALAPVQNVAAAALLLLAAGACFSTWATSGQSIVLLDAPEALRARLGSFLLFAFLGVQPLGSLLAGYLADAGGTALAFVVAGVVGAAATLAALVVLLRANALAGGARGTQVVFDEPPA